jgi:HK97 family phage prohead protease
VELIEFLGGVVASGGRVKEEVSLFVPVMLGNEQCTRNNVQLANGEKLSDPGKSEQLAVSREQLSGDEKSGDLGKQGGNGDLVSWCFSTFDLDRYDERVDPAGWILEHYERNPVIQWAHRWDIPAIGRACDLVADEGGLRGNIVFNATDYDPFGWSIGERVKAGVLRAGSVGFRPLEVEIPEQGKKKDDTALIFRKQELLEFSICNVPANPFALRQCTMNDEQGTMGKKVSREFGGWGWIMK